MGLQIRVRHALGERVMDLPDRTVDEPVVVGRSSSADVQVPWVTVAPKHCVLFIHDGHWAVQSLGAGGGTFVNGEPVQGARLLQIGDVIQVGPESGAPTIEVDPAAAAEGRHGYAGAGLPHMAASGGYGTYAEQGNGYGQQAGYAAPQYAARRHPAQQYAAPAATPPPYTAPAETEYHQTDEISYTPSSTPSYSSYRRPKKSSSGMVAVMIIAVVLVGGLVAFVIYRNDGPKVIVEKKPDVVIVRSNPNSRPTAMFDGLGNADTTLDNVGKAGKSARPAGNTTSSGVKPAGSAVVDPRKENPDNAPTSGDQPSRPLESQTVVPGMEPKEPPKKTTASEPGMDPIRKPSGNDEPGMDPIRKPAPAAPTGPDAETMDAAMASSWDTMKQLAENPGKESFAVLRFEDFRRQNPGKFDKELDDFIDQKMDRIWWERIDQLFRKMEKLNTDIEKTQNEIFDENNPAIKTQKIAALKTMKSDLEASTKELRDNMAYGEEAAPNLGSSAELASLAQKRDKLKYDGWKKATIFYIKSNQGRLRWMNEI